MTLLRKKTDHELIHQFRDGDLYALEALIVRHKDKLYTSILFLVKDKYLAEDIFQDVLIKIIDTIRGGRYTEEGKFLPWVTRIAHNLVIDHFRREKRAPMVNNGDDFDIFEVLGNYDESTEDRLVREQTHKDLKTLIHLLPAEQKEVLIMRHFGDMSFKEIADVTDVSINTALGRMRYALNNLRKMMLNKELSLKN